MNTVLYLCEKPPQARMLAKALNAVRFENGAFFGNGVIVTYSFGHIIELDSPDSYLEHSDWRVSDLPILPNEWLCHVSAAGREQFDNIGKCLALSDSAVIATDADEEGEVIGREILAAHEYAKPVKRLWISALDSDSLSKALSELLPLSATDSYYRAGKIRREMDWLLGFNLSRAFTLKTGKTANVGRVKTRILAELIRREYEIAQFVPEPISTVSTSICGYDFAGELTALNDFGDAVGVCVASDSELVALVPPLPYSLSALLIHANQVAGITLSSGYEAAQALYLAGAISYPRTSSTVMPTSGNKAFAAHHAIIATQMDCPPWADDAMRCIFDLVRTNGVYHNIGQATLLRSTTVFDFGGVRLRNITDTSNEDAAGWLLCKPDVLGALTSARPPAFRVGERARVTLRASQTETEAPSRYNEASLLQMMIDKGIGTEATRVDSISHLLRDKVASYSDGFFVPTSDGSSLAGSLPDGICEEMNNIVALATEQARKKSMDDGLALLNAAKWLVRVIRGVQTVEVADVY